MSLVIHSLLKYVFVLSSNCYLFTLFVFIAIEVIYVQHYMYTYTKYLLGEQWLYPTTMSLSSVQIINCLKLMDGVIVYIKHS